ncbi:MFS transporter [Microbacterium sp. NC79]|uniref:MFS transporter n=1 Tax=Microbacterium sp. NC79 TaxID=2851009 RepID=UPI00349FA536
MTHSPAEPTSLIAQTGRAYFPIALIARLPFAMNVVGVLTLVVAARGSIATGGLTAAAVGLGTAVAGPLLGAAADRFGQRHVMLLSGIANALALVLMSWIAFAPVADSWLLAVAVLVGASAPQVGPLSRTRLVAYITRMPKETRGKTIQGVLAYESAVDEIVFIFGPVLVGLLATTMNPAAPLIGAAALTLVFVSAFALHHSANVSITRTDASARVEQAPARELYRFRILVVVLGMLATGLFFGSALTSLTAWMEDRGAAEQTGLLYGLMGVTSAVLALSFAFFPARFTFRARWLTFAAIMTAGSVLIATADTVPTMMIALAVTGIGVGPVIVNAYSLATERTPRGRSATVMTMLGSAVVVGQSSASAIVGAVAESSGTAIALWATVVSAFLLLLLGVMNALLRTPLPTR